MIRGNMSLNYNEKDDLLNSSNISSVRVNTALIDDNSYTNINLQGRKEFTPTSSNFDNIKYF